MVWCLKKQTTLRFTFNLHSGSSEVFTGHPVIHYETYNKSSAYAPSYEGAERSKTGYQNVTMGRVCTVASLMRPRIRNSGGPACWNVACRVFAQRKCYSDVVFPTYQP